MLKTGTCFVRGFYQGIRLYNWLRLKSHELTFPAIVARYCHDNDPELLFMRVLFGARMSLRDFPLFFVMCAFVLVVFLVILSLFRFLSHTSPVTPQTPSDLPSCPFVA